jgi:hypothetical protein
MRKTALCLWLLVPVGAVADDFPQRKSGLWEIQTAMTGQASGNTMKQCIDAASDAKMMRMGKDMGKKMGANCAKNEFRKTNQNFISESDCTIDGMRMVSKTVFSGDFSSAYTGETTITYEPPVMGTREQKMTISARWIGPCEAGQQPGDIMLPGGMKMNIYSMGKLGGDR